MWKPIKEIKKSIQRGACINFFFARIILKLHYILVKTPPLPFNDSTTPFFLIALGDCEMSNQEVLGHSSDKTFQSQNLNSYQNAKPEDFFLSYIMLKVCPK